MSEQTASMGDQVLVGAIKTLFWVAAMTIRLAWFLRNTVIWVILLALAFQMPLFFRIVAVLLVIGVWAWRPVRPWALGSDVLLVGRVIKRIAANKRGNALLRQWGIVPKADPETYPVFFYRGSDDSSLEIEDAIPGLSPARLREIADTFRLQIKAKRVAAELEGFPQIVRFYHTDPLDALVEIHEPEALNVGKMAVTVGQDEKGQPVTISFKETPGVVLGGLPGGGKTAAASMMVAPFALDPSTDLVVLDAKGGDDWTAYRDLATTFVRESTDFGRIRDALKEQVDEMDRRVATNLEVLGVSNFWEASPEARRRAGLPFRLIIFDECSACFDATGLTKEEKAIRDEIVKHATKLVKLGRSAGMTIVFITQKPTAEALPTAIRDNSGLRVSLRVASEEAEKAILGPRSDDPDAATPLAIPRDRKGGAVMEMEDGSRSAFRFYYWPEPAMREFLRTHDKTVTAA